MAAEQTGGSGQSSKVARPATPAVPTAAEAAYLRLGLDQPGGKLPLFDAQGQPVRAQVIRACLARGWAERWFANPMAPEWLVCRLTERGAQALGALGRYRLQSTSRSTMPWAVRSARSK